MTDLSIKRLGGARFPSPIHLGTEPGDLLADFTPDDERIIADLSMDRLREQIAAGAEIPSIEKAGPREKIYFEPVRLKAGIVTCGGLCPGLNNVIRGLVMTLYHGYGVRDIKGFSFGYAGLDPSEGHPIVQLEPEDVRNIHTMGGTILGTSRGPRDPAVMVDRLEELGIGLLFTVGGDGTFRGALAIQEEIERRGARIGVVGVPKTIDNDIMMVDKTFGFETAVGIASEVIRAAYYESRSAKNGIGLVKLMGRHSGFIAATAALAMRNVNLVLVPEMHFDLEGPKGLYGYLEGRFAIGKSTVIVVAEGAGQRHLEEAAGADASGNAKLGDIGIFLKDRIRERFAARVDFTLKYIDPSYIIRSAPAGPPDAIFCGYLAQAAAHAGMSGRTGMAVGRSHGEFTHIPLEALVAGRKQIDPEGDLWLSVLESTGQPFFLTEEAEKDLSRTSLGPSK